MDRAWGWGCVGVWGEVGSGVGSADGWIWRIPQAYVPIQQLPLSFVLDEGGRERWASVRNLHACDYVLLKGVLCVGVFVSALGDLRVFLGAEAGYWMQHTPVADRRSS